MTNTQYLVRENISSAIRRYLDALEGKNGATLHDLAKALDGLVVAYHQTPDVEPDTTDASLAPSVDEATISDAASEAVPDLGWYALVDPQGGQNQKIGMSIAVSDLAEIASDLSEVLWLFENAGHNDAVWDFRFGYQTHWGRHLHEVRTYLHDLAAW
jgi:hypothetical protein